MRKFRCYQGMAVARLLAVLVIMLGLGLVVGCDSDKPSDDSSGTSTDQPVELVGDEEGLLGIELEGIEGGFFDDESLLEGAFDLASEQVDALCLGDGTDVHGMVLAPYARMAMKWQFPDWLVGKAMASPLEKEAPVGDVQVRLYQVDGKGVQVGEDFAQTRTTQGGRFCVRLPKGVEPGGTVMVEAFSETEGKAYRLRRILINTEDADVHLATESFVEILLENRVDLSRAPLANLMNLEVYSQTAIDLLNPIELSDEGGIDDGLKLVKKTLLDDERFAAGLERLKQVSKPVK